MVQQKSSEVKKIYIPVVGGSHWIAGIQYTRNLLRALSLLPEKEKPEVVLGFNDKNKGDGYQEEFGRYRNVFTDGAKLSDTCSVAFPVKDPNLPGNFEKIFWIPDFQYKRYPDYFPAEDRKKRDDLYARTLVKNPILVLSSQSVKDDFLELFPESGNITVRILNFCTILEDQDYALNSKGTCGRYFVPDLFAYLPNQFFAHKRHDIVFKALGMLKRQGLTIPLVCTGSERDYRNQEYYRSLLALLKENELENQVQLLGLIPRDDQLQIFRQAALIIQPSMFEGWSTIVEDARALGKDILLSDIPTHKEQAPPYAAYFKAVDTEDCAEKISSVWSRCKAGIQVDREEAARVQMRLNGIKFARIFMGIAQEAHERYMTRNHKN